MAPDADARSREPAADGLLGRMVTHGHLVPSGAPGVFGRGRVCDAIHAGLDVLISTTAAEDQPEPLRFPPVVPRRLLDEVGYSRGFPHLCAAIVGIDTTRVTATGPTLASLGPGDQAPTALALLPAACYPAYPAVARRGPVPAGGVTLDLGPTTVFRNEPSDDPARLQVFHQRELVRIGSEPDVLAWRARWMRKAAALYAHLGLEASIVPAGDPFFGRGGRLLARNQREDGLKYEAVVPIADTPDTAVSSFNHHRDQLAAVFGLVGIDGTTAHTGCVGFGMERLALALFSRHGCDVAGWPTAVADALGLGSNA